MRIRNVLFLTIILYIFIYLVGLVMNYDYNNYYVLSGEVRVGGELLDRGSICLYGEDILNVDIEGGVYRFSRVPSGSYRVLVFGDSRIGREYQAMVGVGLVLDIFENMERDIIL